MSFNDISHIENNVFEDMVQLKYLNLRKNQLKELPLLKSMVNFQYENFYNVEYHMETNFMENFLNKEDFLHSLPEHLLSNQEWIDTQVSSQYK